MPRKSQKRSRAQRLRYGGLYDWIAMAGRGVTAPFRAVRAVHRGLNKANDFAGQACGMFFDRRSRLECQNRVQHELARASGSRLLRMGAGYNAMRNRFNYTIGRY